MKRSDKFALFLVALIGVPILMIGLFLDLGGAFKDTATFHPGGWSSLIWIWLSLCMIVVAPIWLLLKACAALSR